MSETVDYSRSLFTQVSQMGFPPSRHKKHCADLGQPHWCASCCPHLSHECKPWAASCLYESMWEDWCDSSSATLSKKYRPHPWKAPTGEV